VQTWVDGKEDEEFVGVGARFGTTIVSKEKNANYSRLTLSDPRDCCSTPKNKVHHNARSMNGIQTIVSLTVLLIHEFVVLACRRCHYGTPGPLQIHH